MKRPTKKAKIHCLLEKARTQDNWITRLEEIYRKKAPTKKSHDGGQTDRHSTGCPKIKRARAKEAPGRSPLYSKEAGAARRKSHNGGPDR